MLPRCKPLANVVSFFPASASGSASVSARVYHYRKFIDEKRSVCQLRSLNCASNKHTENLR